MSTDTPTESEERSRQAEFTDADRDLFTELSEEFADDERGRIFEVLAQSASESSEVSS